jgi:hypothetical protein
MELDSKLAALFQSRLGISSPTSLNCSFVDTSLTDKYENAYGSSTDIGCDYNGQWMSADNIEKLLMNTLSGYSSVDYAQRILCGEKLKAEKEVTPRNLNADLLIATNNTRPGNIWGQHGIGDQFQAASSVAGVNSDWTSSAVLQKNGTDIWHKTVSTPLAMPGNSCNHMQTRYQPTKIDNGTGIWYKSPGSTGPSQTMIPSTWNLNTKVIPPSRSLPSGSQTGVWKSSHQVKILVTVKNAHIYVVCSQQTIKFICVLSAWYPN